MTTSYPTSPADRFAKSDYLATAIIMGLMGAFFWAIRGTSGFGGSSGGTLAGLGWATLWLGFSRFGGDAARRPYGNGRMFAAITFGIAYGGFTGYGVYTAWVNGLYQMNREVSRELPAWTGYAMLFLCGTHWGGVTGAFMSWCAPRQPPDWLSRHNWLKWLLRLTSGVGGAILAVWVVRRFPQYFLPFYNEGYYQVEAYDISIRAMRSLPNVMQHVGLFLGFLLFEIVRRDWRAVKLMALMSLGFAIPFAVGGYWHTVHKMSSLDIDWWKNWEMTIGMGGGLAFGLAFYLFNRPAVTPGPRPTTRLERIFGIGLTLWFAVGVVLLGAWEGFIRVRHLEEWLEGTRPWAFWAYVTMGTLTLIAWICRNITMAQDRLREKGPVPAATLAALIGLIVLAGYVTSIPTELRLANRVLLTLYSIYIGMSGILFWILGRRRMRSQARTKRGQQPPPID